MMWRSRASLRTAPGRSCWSADGNSRLEDSLRALPGVRLATVEPAGYPEATAGRRSMSSIGSPLPRPHLPAPCFSPPAVPWLPAAFAGEREPGGRALGRGSRARGGT